MTKKFAIISILIVALFSVGCSQKQPYPENQQEVTLITGGYGYEVGDIVLVDTEKEPKPGDIVQYDWSLNKSSCFAMGPNVYLAKIIGLPGENASFGSTSFSANGFSGSFSSGKPTLWGTTRLEGIANTELTVPAGEYLADKWLGYECTGEVEGGSSKTYDRFTVKKEAITGVILKKLGHDKKFEEEQKGIVY